MYVKIGQRKGIMQMKKISALEIAEYIMESMVSMYEDGSYYAHYNPDKGLNYEGNTDPENITVLASCNYADDLDRYEMEQKENTNDSDFMRICEELAEKLNEEIEKL